MATSKIPEPTDIVAPRVLVLQIVVGALVVGLLIMVALSVVLPPMVAPGNQGPGPAAGAQPFAMITIIAFVFAVVLVPLSVVIPSRMVTSARKTLAKQPPSDDVPALMTVYQTKTIVTGALREGMGHFAAIAFLIERQSAALGLAFACVIGVGMLFPTRERVERWLESQIDRLTQDREFGT
jgi:hypothetical protein